MKADEKLPLAGLTVVAIEQAVAAPLATRHLADWGARVIKIERPGTGDFARGYDTRVKGLSSYFVWLNRSKESLTLDLKRAEATEIVTRLIAKADVLVHNLAPGAMDRLGFSSAALRASYPRLIICEVSGYGSSGPYRDRKAYDLLVQSEAGLLSVTGTPDTPSKAGISIADIAAGMYAYSAILTALLRRSTTGDGAAIEVSMLDALGEWMSHPVYATTYGESPLPRSGARHAAIAPYGPFASGDGESVFLSIQNEREWKRFCSDALMQPALAADPRFATNTARVENRDVLEAAINKVFAALTTSEIVARLDAADIAHARLNSVEEFAAHPQLTARERWREIDSAVGPLRALLPPVIMDDIEPAMGAVPTAGEHTETILAELGYNQATISGWREGGII
ncbi:MAG TPA: CaiB/BaiF CoA-transferase family protein [Gemmatimonadaceae bacterium]|nr:CaiB/BaiF CoA-transferase family protein [Gemmatimonadaceae bacterium]